MKSNCGPSVFFGTFVTLGRRSALTYCNQIWVSFIYFIIQKISPYYALQEHSSNRDRKSLQCGIPGKFYLTKLPGVISEFRKTKLYKKSVENYRRRQQITNLFNNTDTYIKRHTTSGIYILMSSQHMGHFIMAKFCQKAD